MAAIEWAPGEKSAWKPVDSSDVARERDTKSALSQVLKHSITALSAAKEYIYAGASEGRLLVSPDAGLSWPQEFKLKDKKADLGSVQAIWVDINDPRVAVAVLGDRPVNPENPAKPSYVLRTMNGGLFWDDITVNLPDNAVAHGVTADRGTGAIYVATDVGVFFTMTDLTAAGGPTSWTSLGEGLPAAAAIDGQPGGGGHPPYFGLDGYGGLGTIAPH